MTEAAQRFVSPLTFQALTRREVFTSLWQSEENFRSNHISLSERADLMAVAPATADIIAKFAGGIAGRSDIHHSPVCNRGMSDHDRPVDEHKNVERACHAGKRAKTP